MKTIPPSRKHLLIGASAAVALLLLAGGAWLHLHEEAGHAHGDHPAALPELKQGVRWESDAPLRTSMLAIRDAVAAARTAPAPLDSASAQALATGVEEQIGNIVKNCRLAPEADATLHHILAGLAQGAQSLAAGGPSAKGIAELTLALDQYQRYFNHPDWQPLTAPHSAP